MLESLSTEEMEFIKAIESYKSEKQRLFLSWSEVLKILKELGYRKKAIKAPAAEEEKATSA